MSIPRNSNIFLNVIDSIATIVKKGYSSLDVTDALKHSLIGQLIKFLLLDQSNVSKHL